MLYKARHLNKISLESFRNTRLIKKKMVETLFFCSFFMSFNYKSTICVQRTILSLLAFFEADGSAKPHLGDFIELEDNF